MTIVQYPKHEGSNPPEFALYRMFGADGELLYIGRSTSAAQRLSAHSQRRHFWHLVTTIRIERLADMATLIEAERVAIETERPKFNIDSNPDNRASKRRTSSPAGQLTLTVAEAADLLGISQRLVYDLVKRGDLRAITLGRRIMIPKTALAELVDGTTEAAS